MKDRTKPYPIVIASDREGDQPYEYTLIWEKPETGGLPIEEYMIGIRRVKSDENFGIIELIDQEYSFIMKDDPSNNMRSYKMEGTYMYMIEHVLPVVLCTK